jgi:protease I
MGRLEGKRIAVVATDGFELSEYTSPKDALMSEGARVEVIAPHSGSIKSWRERNWGESVDVDAEVEKADADDYDALLLPGGVMNPDQLRSNPAIVDFVSQFVKDRKPIAAICHGPWTLIETGAVDGRRMTSYPSLKTDLINAGAKWTDEAFVIDRGLVTSRSPGDLPVFNEKMIEVFGEGPVEASSVEEEDETEDTPEDEAHAVEATAVLERSVGVAPEPSPEPAPAPRPKRKQPASTGARAKAAPRKSAKVQGQRPRGAKQAPRRRAPKRH